MKYGYALKITFVSREMLNNDNFAEFLLHYLIFHVKRKAQN